MQLHAPSTPAPSRSLSRPNVSMRNLRAGEAGARHEMHHATQYAAPPPSTLALHRIPHPSAQAASPPGSPAERARPELVPRRLDAPLGRPAHRAHHVGGAGGCLDGGPAGGRARAQQGARRRQRRGSYALRKHLGSSSRARHRQGDPCAEPARPPACWQACMQQRLHGYAPSHSLLHLLLGQGLQALARVAVHAALAKQAEAAAPPVLAHLRMLAEWWQGGGVVRRGRCKMQQCWHCAGHMAHAANRPEDAVCWPPAPSPAAPGPRGQSQGAGLPRRSSDACASGQRGRGAGHVGRRRRAGQRAVSVGRRGGGSIPGSIGQRQHGSHVARLALLFLHGAASTEWP